MYGQEFPAWMWEKASIVMFAFTLSILSAHTAHTSRNRKVHFKFGPTTELIGVYRKCAWNIDGHHNAGSFPYSCRIFLGFQGSGGVSCDIYIQCTKSLHNTTLPMWDRKHSMIIPILRAHLNIFPHTTVHTQISICLTMYTPISQYGIPVLVIYSLHSYKRSNHTFSCHWCDTLHTMW